MELESLIDEKGRICIPSSIRKKLALKTGEKLFFQVDDNNKIILNRKTTPDEFVDQARKFRQALKKATKEPIGFEKLFD